MIADNSSVDTPVQISETVSGWALFYKVTASHTKHIVTIFSGYPHDYIELQIGAWHLLLITNGYA